MLRAGLPNGGSNPQRKADSTMKYRIILASAAAPAAIAISLIGASAASASTGPVAGTTQPNGTASIVQMTGKNGVSYTDPVFGPVHCDEVHHYANVKTLAPDFDSVTCQSTTGLPLPGVTPGQVETVGWNSDFSTRNWGEVNTGSITLTVSADGLSYTGIATYPNG
jgi:hypothetical protein